MEVGKKGLRPNMLNILIPPGSPPFSLKGALGFQGQRLEIDR